MRASLKKDCTILLLIVILLVMDSNSSSSSSSSNSNSSSSSSSSSSDTICNISRNSPAGLVCSCWEAGPKP